MDFPGCILAGVSAAGFIGTMADNKSLKQMMRFTKSVSSIVREKWSLENRSSVLHRPLLCLLVFSPFIQLRRRDWNTDLALNFVTSQDQNAPCFYSVHPPRLNTNKVINAVISSSSFTIEKPKRSPQGHLCLCSSCPCLPSFTPGPFHWEKDAGWGAALQIPPGCGICNKQPRGMSAALSLLLKSLHKLIKQPPIFVLICVI